MTYSPRSPLRAALRGPLHRATDWPYLIPYKVGRFAPPLVADFVEGYYRVDGADTTFGDMFTFARASAGTYMDSSGVLQTASSGVARVGHHVYESGSWVNKGLLLESAAATNLVLQGRDISNAAWNTVALASVARDAVGVDGVANSATTLTADGTTDSVFNAVDITVTQNTVYTFSFWAKAGTATGLKLAVRDQTGAAFISSDISYTPGTGVFMRVTHTFTTPSGCVALRIYPLRNLSTTGTVIIDGVQLESGGVPTSTIFTEGSTVTRAAETLTITAANAPAGSGFSLDWKGEASYADTESTTEIHMFERFKDSGNYRRFAVDTSGGGGLRQGALRALQIGESGTLVSARGTDTDYTPGLNRTLSVAVRYTPDELEIAKDGASLTTTETTITAPDLSNTNVDVGKVYTGTISQIRMWGEDIGHSGIEEASS